VVLCKKTIKKGGQKMNNKSKNMSMTVCIDNARLGEIIHWQKTGVIESWHYKNAFGLAEQTIDIATFDEQHLADAIRFAKFGERPETCLA
jgi:hypothetical protein